MVNWIDDADCYRCPICGYETHNPNQHGCKCPVCGFIADIDKNRVEREKVELAEKCLLDNGIDADEVQVVLQAIGYILLDQELYPDD